MEEIKEKAENDELNKAYDAIEEEPKEYIKVKKEKKNESGER